MLCSFSFAIKFVILVFSTRLQIHSLSIMHSSVSLVLEITLRMVSRASCGEYASFTSSLTFAFAGKSNILQLILQEMTIKYYWCRIDDGVCRRVMMVVMAWLYNFDGWFYKSLFILSLQIMKLTSNCWMLMLNNCHYCHSFKNPYIS